MRPIKFRAWHPEDKKMLTVFHWHKGDKIDSINRLRGFTGEETLFVGKDIELMQYTGLKDKNGKESYWDDIADDGINQPFVITDDYHLLARLSEIKFEVIGNIYSNKELLE